MMKNVRRISLASLLTALGFVAGCGGSSSGVQVVVPGDQVEMHSKAPDTGQFSVYRAWGFNGQTYPAHTQRLWTVSARDNEPMGFRWERPQNVWSPDASMHLIAYVGSQTRDLGTMTYRDEKVVWAGANADLGGYWQSRGQVELGNKLTLH